LNIGEPHRAFQGLLAASREATALRSALGVMPACRRKRVAKCCGEGKPSSDAWSRWRTPFQTP